MAAAEMGRSGGWVAGGALAVGLLESTARALPPAQKASHGRTALSYVVEPGTPGCDSESDFREYLANIAGGDPFIPMGPPQHTVQVVIRRVGNPFHGVLELRDAAGEVTYREEIVERACAAVEDRLTLLLAAVVFQSKYPPPPPSGCDDACIEGLRADVARLKVTVNELREEHNALQKKVDEGRVRSMNLTYALSTGVLITANLTPNVGPGVWLGGEARSGPLSLGLEFRVVLPSRVPVGPYDLDLSQYVALLVPCGRYSYFFGCGVAGAGGQLEYDSNSPTGAQGRSNGLLQFGGRLGGEVPFADNRLAVRAWGEVLWKTPHVDDSYGKEGTSNYVRRELPDVSAFFGVGFVVKFGDQEAR